jgi:hypothetical protein
MGGTNPVASILAGAKKTLETANKKFPSSMASAIVTPPAKPAGESPATQYSHARTARKGGEFMGVKSNQAPEINTALEARETAKKALEQ